MRKAATFRLDADLLAKARRCAREDNRSLTNLVETLLISRVGEAPVRGAVPEAARGQWQKDGPVR